MFFFKIIGKSGAFAGAAKFIGRIQPGPFARGSGFTGSCGRNTPRAFYPCSGVGNCSLPLSIKYELLYFLNSTPIASALIFVTSYLPFPTHQATNKQAEPSKSTGRGLLDTVLSPFRSFASPLNRSASAASLPPQAAPGTPAAGQKPQRPPLPAVSAAATTAVAALKATSPADPFADLASSAAEAAIHPAGLSDNEATPGATPTILSPREFSSELQRVPERHTAAMFDLLALDDAAPVDPFAHTASVQAAAAAKAMDPPTVAPSDPWANISTPSDSWANFGAPAAQSATPDFFNPATVAPASAAQPATDSLIQF
jgi:hypothetical protein